MVQGPNGPFTYPGSQLFSAGIFYWGGGGTRGVHVGVYEHARFHTLTKVKGQYHTALHLIFFFFFF